MRRGSASVLGGRPSTPRRVPLAVVAVAILGATMVVTALGTSTEFWTGVFAHEARTARHGGEIASTTIEGARWWRVALATSGVLLPLMALLMTRLVCGGAAATPVEAADSRPRDDRGPCDLLLLVLLLAAGLSLRATRIGESLWYDEIADFLAFGQFGPGPTMGNYFTPSNHILNGILCWGAVQVAGGANEIVLRLPALLASLASIVAFRWLGREVAADVSADGSARGVATTGAPGAAPALPWLMAGFAALAPVMVLEAVEARGYALMILASALATAAFLRGTRLSIQRRPEAMAIWSLYAVAVTLGVWAHLVTSCVAAGHALVLVGDLRSARRRRAALAGMLAVLAAAVLTLVLYSPALPDVLAIRDQFKALDGDEPTLLGPEGVHALLQIGGAWSWWAALPGLALAGLGLIAASRNAALRRAVAACLLGGVIAALLAWLGNSWLYARFVLFTLPGAAILIGLGASWLLGRRRGVALSAAAISILVGAWLPDLWLRPPKQPLREAVLEVARARAPTDRVATVGLLDNVLEWYAAPQRMPMATTGVLGSHLAQVLDRDHPEWVIVLYGRSVPPERVAELTRRGYVLHSVHEGWVDWGAGDVAVWREARDSHH